MWILSLQVTHSPTNMGNTTAKLSDSPLSKDEMPLVTGCFKNVARNSEKIKEDELMKFWGSQMDPRLAQYITNYLFGPLATRTSTVELKRFAELFVYCVRGSIDERTNVLFGSLGQNETEAPDIAYPLIKEYVEAVVSSYMRALRLQGDPRYKSWEMKNYKIVKDCVQKLAESLVFDVVQQGTQRVARADAEKWLSTTPIFLKMLTHVFLHLYSYRVQYPKSGGSAKERKVSVVTRITSDDTNLLPMCEGLINTPQLPGFIDLSQIIFINSNLPNEYKHKWRFLFSSQMHGESFSTFLGRIQNQGATILLIEDSNDFVFGGFAPSEWKLSPKFSGTPESFLLTLKPKMRCFFSSGYNTNFQYLNLHQQTMPNGLGMGGQFNYWGLWIDSEYGQGACSESCTTFKGYTQLGPNKTFKIKNLEVWGVGDLPTKSDDSEETVQISVLDKNSENKAMLEMIGRKQHSDGYREPAPDTN